MTLVLHDGVDPDYPDLDALRAAGVHIVDDRVRRIVTGDDGHVAFVDTAGGTRIAADAVAIATRFSVRADIFAPLGVTPAPHPTGLGDFIETDPTGATSVPGLYAAGNVTDPSQQVLQAAAQGGWVGGMISFSLAQEDIASAARPSSNEADWDHRYSADQLWNGNPNGTLVKEIGNAPTGRALDVGAGEGGDAVWLAEQGWRVTATDISQRGLDRIRAVANDRGLPIECRHNDANAYRPVRTRSVRLGLGTLRVHSSHARWSGSGQPAQRGRPCSSSATISQPCGHRSTRTSTAERSTPTRTSGSRTSSPGSPTPPSGISSSTTNVRGQLEPRRPPTMSTTSCCVPAAAWQAFRSQL